MANNRFPHGRGIVRAVTLETLVDPRHPSAGVVNLLCGHCGRLSSETVTLCYCSPEECGVSFEEQLASWESGLRLSHICPRFGVQNVSGKVEEYLRTQREAWAKDDPG